MIIKLLFFILAQAAQAESILIVGDSLTCGSFGENMMAGLAKEGHEVTLYCAASSTAEDWMKGRKPKGQICQTMTSAKQKFVPCPGKPEGDVPAFATLLKRHPTDRVITALGTNSLGGTSGRPFYGKMAKAIVDSGARCDWIGPPHMNLPQTNFKVFPNGVETHQKNLNSFYDWMDESVGSRCSIIDSRDATAKGEAGHDTTDGVHRTSKAGQAWWNALAPRVLKGPSRSSLSNDSPSDATR